VPTGDYGSSDRRPSAVSRQPYVGRFAPSPTGSLHLGSLFAAVASFLDARAHGGRWLVRIEDVDTPRVVPGSTDEILRTLDRLALHWDGEVVHQSRRTASYDTALASLTARGLTFDCSCSRRELAGLEERGYPGTCRGGPVRPGPTSTRFRIPESGWLTFRDRVQGEVRVDLATVGDVVVRRRDGLHAYQLAVVVDDAEQGVTDVVRGCDLLPSTAWQLELQRALGVPAPRYAHVPVLVEPDGSKLAKSRRSIGVAGRDGEGLEAVLALLGCRVPPELHGAPPERLLEWAVPHFGLEPLRGIDALQAPEAS
jgi:glutamyl-Q tRNA(Asp) synthetase